MALTRKNDISPEEQLLKLIEKPAVGETVRLGEGSINITIGRKKKNNAVKFIAEVISLPIIFIKGTKRISLKTVNRFCLVAITILLGYAIYSAVSAETPTVEKLSIKDKDVEEIDSPQINDYYEEINKRDVFKDMYVPPPVVVEPPKVTPVISPAATQEIMPPAQEILKNLKVIGIIWEPPATSNGLVIIENKLPGGAVIRCLAVGETFIAKVEVAGNLRDVLIEVKEIQKSKVILKYETGEGSLTITEESEIPK
ncbi:MAG: hypothetical protein QME51_02240 [Planctomycetota bacterium]|nr:hypothetical protein [Planctomycetota bacterium]MDI6787173.1 hypothetical protein [Planctomycetota bacterium]